jgi:hypothetical protein
MDPLVDAYSKLTVEDKGIIDSDVKDKAIA